jgi:hypothetical protein
LTIISEAAKTSFASASTVARGSKNIFCLGQHGCTRGLVIRIGVTDAGSSVRFDDDIVAIVDHFVDARGCHADTKLERLNLFWYSDFHGSLQT